MARKPRVVTGTPSVQLGRNEFILRFHQRHRDPAFDAVAAPLSEVAAVAWKNYVEYRKAPRTRRAGKGYANPSYALSEDWIAARAAIREAARKQRRRTAP